MTKNEQIHKQYSQELEQSQLVGYWSKVKGFNSSDLDKHPRIDDVILLIKYRDALWNILNKSERATWGAYWGYTYKKRRALKNKALKKLEHITITAQDRHLKYLIKQASQIKTIKAIRETKQQKEDQTMTAKGSSNAYDIPWK